VKGSNLHIWEQGGNQGRVSITDTNQSTAVIHTMGTVLLPR